MENEKALRIAALDGLRLIAFLLVFVSHFPTGGHPWYFRGWMGVDIFFALSSFLFVSQFEREHQKTGRIAIPSYFIRRFFRIYPLMILFAVYMMWWIGKGTADEWLRILGLILSIDNVIHAFHLAGTGIPLTEHLWSLSYEFQTYLILPAIFLVSTRVQSRTMIALLLGAAAYGGLARFVVSELGAEHPVVYALPFFRPESIVAGLLLAIVKPNWRWQWSAGTALVSLLAFMALPDKPYEGRLAVIFSYPSLGVFCFALIDTAIRSPLRVLLAYPAIAHLGKRTYAMYILHILAITYAMRFLAGRLGAEMSNPAWIAAWCITSLALVVLWSELSFWLVERWTEKLGRRFSHIVSGVGRPSSPTQSSPDRPPT